MTERDSNACPASCDGRACIQPLDRHPPYHENANGWCWPTALEQCKRCGSWEIPGDLYGGVCWPCHENAPTPGLAACDVCGTLTVRGDRETKCSECLHGEACACSGSETGAAHAYWCPFADDGAVGWSPDMYVPNE